MRAARPADDGVRARSFRIQPALTIDEATAKNGVAILREVFDVVERERLWQSLSAAPRRAAPPPLRGWRDKLAHVIAVWFGCGHVPYAPGHAGTIGSDPALPAGAPVRPARPSPRRRWS